VSRAAGTTGGSPWDSTLGDPIQPASHVLTLNVSRINDFQRCRRMFFLRWVLRLTGDDPLDTDASWIGSTTHEALHTLHRPGRFAHHETDPHGELHDAVSTDPRVGAMIRTHTLLCPGGQVDYLAGEIEARWLIARKSVLLTGRFDALWRYPDGVVEVRDYKTGRCPDSLDHDLGAAIYLLLAANFPGSRTPEGDLRPIRVVYEALASPEGRAVSVVASPDLLRDAFNEIVGLAEHIRKEKSFPASPSLATCRSCSFRNVCPASAAEPDDR
jgi:RecB family exonuclease